ncbi:uncharacterized protein PFL1_06117 [Pseudozyma flocculosa PF-1]|uniref:RING-type domain-containing protein n=1 Tax=Pseudozyma flocculosa PF-1 TaxID=1277687 RepID=A0A061H2K5_9BASI|nr:uncharacterized protein PFL1_06117 [Pseudozyma flocculosa PF-1]EPQ26469.1 hypothetical protein PFL1_06117 [Pseudozyma flocculosa PF-1]
MAAMQPKRVERDVERNGFAMLDGPPPQARATSSQIGGDLRREAGCAEARAILGISSSKTGKQARDPLVELVPAVIEIFPDMDHAHALTKLRQLFLEHECPLDDLVERICAEILEQGADYPRIEAKGKRKASSETPTVGTSASTAPNSAHAPPPPPKANHYRTEGRPKTGRIYRDEAARLLRAEFPQYPPVDCRRLIEESRGYFAPARKQLLIMSLEAQAEVHSADPPRPAKKLKRKESADSILLQRRATALVLEQLDSMRAFIKAPAALKEEVLWVYSEEGEAVLASEMPLPSAGIECGCCFDDDIPFEHFVQCRDGHLFCKSCAQHYAEERIGMRIIDLPCIDGGGCEAGFAESEIQRFLPAKTYQLLERLRQEVSLQRAGIAGLEECPYCPYACVMDNTDDKVFRCLNEDCERTSCRLCKTEDHIPMSCEEAKAQKTRHHAESALSEAVIRKCPTPSCGVALMKFEGCNKIYCTQCRHFMCYVCKQHIPVEVGYKHFNQMSGQRGSKEKSNKCPLWDDGVNRHERELAGVREQLGADAPPT